MALISIIIPCRNEEKYIGRCLDSILGEGTSHDKLEVLVCDGMSTDISRQIILEYAGRFDFIKLIENRDQTTPFALNLGIRQSKGEFILILGAHAELLPGYIVNGIKILNEFPEAGCAGGLLENIYENDNSRAIGKAMSSVFGVGNAHFRTGNRNGWVDTVAFGLYRREVFDKAGLFNEELARNQDDEFNFRILKRGYKIYLSPDMIARYYVRSSFVRLYRQYFQYGYWKVYVNRLHQSITTLRQVIPLLWVMALFTGPLILIFAPSVIWAWLALVLFYLLLAVGFSIRESANPSGAGKTLLAFLILHLSYGLGYLEGLIHFIVLRRKPRSAKSTLTR